MLTCLCVGNVSAQMNSSPCENFGKKDYQGENITIKVEKTDIRDILKTFTEKYGCEFIIDKSVTKIALDVDVSEVPWNILLDVILKSQNVGWQIVGKSLIRIAKAEILADYGSDTLPNNNDKSEPLYTEFIKLNYLSVCDNIYSCTFDKNPSPLHPSKLAKLVGKLLSKGGAIEADSRSNSLVITDTKERITFIRKQIEEWDKPNTNLDEIIKTFESKKQL